MIIAYLALIIVVSLYEAIQLYKNGEIKDMYVFLGSMILVAAFGIFYFLSNIQFSLIDFLLKLLHVEG